MSSAGLASEFRDRGFVVRKGLLSPKEVESFVVGFSAVNWHRDSVQRALVRSELGYTALAPELVSRSAGSEEAGAYRPGLLERVLGRRVRPGVRPTA